MDGDKSDNITGMRGAGLKTVIKYFPEILGIKFNRWFFAKIKLLN